MEFDSGAYLWLVWTKYLHATGQESFGTAFISQGGHPEEVVDSREDTSVSYSFHEHISIACK